MPGLTTRGFPVPRPICREKGEGEGRELLHAAIGPVLKKAWLATGREARGSGLGCPCRSFYLCADGYFQRRLSARKGSLTSLSGLLLKVRAHCDSPGPEWGRLTPRFRLCHSVRPQGCLSSFSISRPSSVCNSWCDVR